MKSKVDKYDVDKLVPVPTDLSKLSDVGNNEVIKKNVYNELVKNINAIKTVDISDLVKKADYDTKVEEIEKKLDHKNDKCITTQEFNNLMADNFAARSKQANWQGKIIFLDLRIALI